MHRRRRHSRALLIARPFFPWAAPVFAGCLLSSRACFFVIQAATAAGFHLFPSRTEQLSPRAPMVLRHSGRVGRRRFPQAPRSLSRSRGAFFFFCFGRPAPGLAPCRGGRRRAAILFSNDELWGKALRIQKLVLYSIGLIEYVYRDCIWAYFISIWYYSINSEVACLMLNPLSSRFDGLGIVH